ncbi:MAG: serine protease Do [Patescibacteria group bacterium]|nr:serine protease Do [Patescibacteria group bacterium]
MDIKDLNKSQLILLAILLSFVISIATGITTVTLMEQAPPSITIPITRVVKETVEKVVPEGVDTTPGDVLSPEEKKLLEELKAIKPLTVSLFLRVGTEDKLLGTGLFLGDNKVVFASIIDSPKEGEVYVIKSVLGEQKVSKVTPEKDFTLVELVKVESLPDINTEQPPIQ